MKALYNFCRVQVWGHRGHNNRRKRFLRELHNHTLSSMCLPSGQMVTTKENADKQHGVQKAVLSPKSVLFETILRTNLKINFNIKQIVFDIRYINWISHPYLPIKYVQVQWKRHRSLIAATRHHTGAICITGRVTNNMEMTSGRGKRCTPTRYRPIEACSPILNLSIRFPFGCKNVVLRLCKKRLQYRLKTKDLVKNCYFIQMSIHLYKVAVFLLNAYKNIHGTNSIDVCLFVWLFSVTSETARPNFDGTSFTGGQLTLQNVSNVVMLYVKENNYYFRKKYQMFLLTSTRALVGDQERAPKSQATACLN